MVAMQLFKTMNQMVAELTSRKTFAIADPQFICLLMRDVIAVNQASMMLLERLLGVMQGGTAIEEHALQGWMLTEMQFE